MIPFFYGKRLFPHSCTPKRTQIAAIGEYPELNFSPIIQIIERQEVSLRIIKHTGSGR